MSRNTAPDHRSRAHFAWKVAAAIVTVASLLWVLLLLVRVWPELTAHSAQIRPLPLLIALVFGLVGAYLAFEVFVALIRLLNIADLPRRELAHLHFTSQLLKHLPGRVWGVGYQWAAGNSVGSLRTWLLINIGQMLFATFFALWGAWLVLGFSHGLQWGILALSGGVVMYVVGWITVDSRWLSRWLEMLPGKFGTTSGDVLDVIAKTPNISRTKIFVFFSATSILYYASWFLNGMGYPPLGGSAAGCS